MVDLNLCDKCKQIYPSQIEPTVKAMLSEFFYDWQGIEAETRFLLAKGLGAYKQNGNYLIDTDWEEDLNPFAEQIDVEKYDWIRHLFFGRVVGELWKNGLIGPELYSLLGEVARRRNRIHRYRAELSEQDRIIFYYVHGLLQHFSIRVRDPNFEPELSDYQKLKEAVDRHAKALMEKIKEI
jgi:hypothetical protein